MSASIVRRPTDVLDTHLSLLEWWETSPYREVFASPYAQGFHKFPGPIHEYIPTRLAHSETVFVRSHIVNKLWGFAKRFDTLDTLLPQDLPFPRAFVYFETPVYMLEARGRIQPIQAVQWSAEDTAVCLIEYGNRKDELDEVAVELGKSHVSLSLEHKHGLIGWQPWPFGQPTARLVDPTWFTDDPSNYRQYDMEGTPSVTAESLRTAAEEGARMNMFLLCLWDWMNDQRPTTMYPDRAGRRRMERAGRGINVVKVVELRSSQGPSQRPETPGEVAWTHRWRRRAHQRRIRDKETGEIRMVAVRSTICGPADLPLVEKDQIFDVKR